jgi:outer membrane immunogenic protein
LGPRFSTKSHQTTTVADKQRLPGNLKDVAGPINFSHHDLRFAVIVASIFLARGCDVMRRNFGWGIVSIIGFGLCGLGNAMAADLPVKAPPAAAAEVFGWSGFYVGGNAGYDWGRAAYNGVLTAPAPFLPIDVAAISTASSPRLKPNGFTGGGQVGYNWQAGGAVFGVEADIQSFRLRASTTGTLPFPSTLPGGAGGPPPAVFTPTT